MRYFYFAFAIFLIVAVSILGFRGTTSEKPPLFIFPDMKWQPTYRPQGESRFFADGRADREPLPGTVARGFLRDDDHKYRGSTSDGDWADGFPMIVSREMMERGADRYRIYCAVCHGGTGDGDGITRDYGMLATPSFHDDRLRDMAEGEIFEVITNGRNLMGAYGSKLTPDDRWAVIAYVRALQRAHQGAVDDVPEADRGELGL